MANFKPVNNFSNLYNKFYGMFNTYQPQSASTLKDAIARQIRPQTDQDIKARQGELKAERAMIDTDAASRGMGPSSWVTDVKTRRNDAAARDIQNIEANYQANLYNGVLNRLNAQDEMALSAAQAAQGNALGLANSMYNQVYGSSGSGGGWGGRRGTTPDETPDETPYDPILANASNNEKAIAARKQLSQDNAKNASNARAASATRRSLVGASNNLNKKVKNRISGQPINRM